MVHNKRQASMVDYTAYTGHHVSRLMTAAEVHVFLNTVRKGYKHCKALVEMLGYSIDIKPSVDIRTVFNVFAKGNNTVERRLQSHICFYL